MVLNDNFKDILIEKVNEIINLEHYIWNDLDKKIKLKYIHRICSYLDNNNNEEIKNNIMIPLKSIKAKKLIQYCGYTNHHNKELYLQFNRLMLEYTNKFREKYINVSKRKYYTYNNIPKNERELILSEINDIVGNFIKNNRVNINKLLESLICSNYDKLILNANKNNEKKNYNINNYDNNIEINTDEIKIYLTLNFTSNNITKNIPVMYYIKLVNKI